MNQRMVLRLERMMVRWIANIQDNVLIDHLAQMMELLGKMPRKYAMGGKYSKDYFNNRGELKFIRSLNMWSLEDVFVEKYKWTKEGKK